MLKYSIVIVSFLVVALSSGICGAMNADSARYIQTTGYRYYDTPIDPDLYLIRPGDILTVTFINANISQLRLVVDPENRIIDPTLGVFDLTGKTLSQTRQLLSRKLLDLYNVNQMAISVGSPQKVAVLVSGAVKAPGLYTAYTSQRVSEIIDSANGIARDGSRRWIQFSGGPSTLIVDLDKAHYLGDYTTNPYLYAGYAVYVPAKSDKRVQVIGEVNAPREIELVPGDSLLLLVQLAGGVRSSGDINNIKVTHTVNHAGNTNAELQAGDVIIVPPKETTLNPQQVGVFGAVTEPGYYTYVNDITLPQLIAQAGGYTQQANKGQLVIFRLSGMDAFGRISTVRYPLISISNGKGHLLPIQPGDSVFIPSVIGYVKVRGVVRNPGLFPYFPEKDISYYIDIAGGLVPSADKENINLYHRFTRISEIVGMDSEVYDGDIITVKPLEGINR